MLHSNVSHKKGNVIRLLPPSELYICSAAKAKKTKGFLLKVVLGGALLQAAAYEGKLSTENKCVLFLVSSDALNVLNEI